jgi:hypothetical protein
MATGLFKAHRPSSTNGQSPSAPAQRSTLTSPSAPLLLPPAGRRRPAMLVGGLMLAAVGAVVSVTTAMAAGNRTPVLIVAHDVAAGQTLTSADLAVVRISADPIMHPLPASARDSVVGQRAAATLKAGTLLISSMLSNASAPAAGTALVPVALKPSELPARPLQAGDRLLLVPAADATSQTPAPAANPVTVVVDEIGTPESDGTVVVDVQVPIGEASGLAQLAAGDHVAVVLLSGSGS